jgi:membrane dipeptidase
MTNPLTDMLVWDNHGCMPLRPLDESFLRQLSRYKAVGVDICSLNIGFDAEPWQNSVLMAAQFRRWLKQRPDKYVLIESAADVHRARAENKLGVSFDIEGGCALNEQLSMVELYYDLGVRWMLMAYNRNNALGGGCQDEDTGLTKFGREVIREMERVGMVTCCSHTGERTCRDVMEYATKPVIFSHSNARALRDHPRNISDEMIKACAASGGVIGINGIGDFLGENDGSSKTFAQHIDHMLQLVGPKHVGIGIDYVFDQQELMDYLKAHPEIFPPDKGYGNRLNITRPEQLPEIAELLLQRGYSHDDLALIMGGNHLRIAKEVWK